ncbi:hypothetical protein [Sutcliffiella horikoshii]|uniref:Lipoprotein n=1 Tax=Sutcliffiella horikoshii TaxID=79883 RepID=A0A5D4T3V1_9BACI|nr:hypothetical protein [Sutcliffiella horikoshii]TYS69328.1 hypothetical protein FZC75_17395 [Sutcliffiella horikoshii]
MKKLIITGLISLIILCACSSQSNGPYVYWTEKTDNQIQQLDQVKINYEIRHGEIWIREKDTRKVVACCS